MNNLRITYIQELNRKDLLLKESVNMLRKISLEEIKRYLNVFLDGTPEWEDVHLQTFFTNWENRRSKRLWALQGLTLVVYPKYKEEINYQLKQGSYWVHMNDPLYVKDVFIKDRKESKRIEEEIFCHSYYKTYIKDALLFKFNPFTNSERYTSQTLSYIKETEDYKKHLY